jgi:hypothetical protein
MFDSPMEKPAESSSIFGRAKKPPKIFFGGHTETHQK